jgi:fibronectin type 3 domain-containing protein
MRLKWWKHLAEIIVPVFVALFFLFFSGKVSADADSDFQVRCNFSGVVACNGFDSASDIPYYSGSPGGLAPASDGVYRGTLDTTNKSSGASSLLFTVPGNTGGADAAGNFVELFGQKFSQNSTFYIQWQQRFDPNYLNNDYKTSSGTGTSWKQTIVWDVNIPSCTATQWVADNYNGIGIAKMYSECGNRSMYTNPSTGLWTGTTPQLIQQGASSTDGYNCPYGNFTAGNGNGVGCFYYPANKWVTFYVRTQIGIFGQSNSSVQAWIAVDGQSYKQYINVPNFTFNADQGTNSGMTGIMLTPYMTGRDNRGYPTAYTWYDELIVSTQPIAAPNATPDTDPPTSPATLAATSPSQSSISVSWAASTDNVGVTGYIVERCQGTGCSNFAQVGTLTASPFIDTGLTANTFYNYHVRATDAASNLSGWSNVVGATTQAPDTQAPTTPSNLQASVASSSSINLTWTASTDNVGVTGYKVERCSGASCTSFTQIGTPSTNAYSDTGLSASTLYRYRVMANDAAGNNSDSSGIAQASTPVAPPSPTFVSEYETAWNSAISPKTTANFSVQSGDTLVAYAVNESSSSTIATPPTGTLTGTWTLSQTISASNFTYVRLWTMNVPSNQTNVNVSFTNSGGNFGGDVLHFRNTSGIGTTAQANSNTGNPTLTMNGVGDNSTLVMINGDWSAKTGTRAYTTSQAGAFTETSAFADGSSYGVEAGYYANAGSAGNKTIGLTAPSGMTWALAAVEVKGNPSTGTFTPCNTVTTANFSQSAYNSYGAPFDAFSTSTMLLNVQCTASDPHTIQLTSGVPGDTTRIVYTKGYYYAGSAWTQYTGTCTGAQNGDWCQGSVSATITNPDISTASASAPAYFVGMTCSVQGGGWKCGCRDTMCANFYWQIQGAGM